MTKQEIQTEALGRALNGQSWSNYPAIFEGFTAKGIPEAEINPRANVLTFHAWKAVGRCVRKGEHGVKVLTYVSGSSERKADDGTTETKAYKFPRTTTVFHISQTEACK